VVAVGASVGALVPVGAAVTAAVRGVPVRFAGPELDAGLQAARNTIIKTTKVTKIIFFMQIFSKSLSRPVHQKRESSGFSS
jgi:hypothetical protein